LAQNLTIRTASERDYPAIVRLQQKAPEAAPWPLGGYAGFLVLLALVDGTPAGFCCWRQTVPDEAELLNLAVDPAYRRTGVGRQLLAVLEQAARGTIFLEVAATNTGAIALYHAAGWAHVAVRKGYYDQGKIDAIVMKKGS
jgi:ribosomal-protein-alanine acetyltransferase